MISITIVIVQNVGSETAFISDSRGVQTKTVVDDLLQVVVDLAAHLHGFRKRGSTYYRRYIIGLSTTTKIVSLYYYQWARS